MKNLLLASFFTVTTMTFSTATKAQEQQLQVGIHGLDMKPKVGIPLAGYGNKRRRLNSYFDWRFQYPESSLFKPSIGYHSPIRSKVMFLKNGSDNLIFVSLDTIGVEDRFIKDIAYNLKKYNVTEEQLVVSATHTHGGPGTLSKRIPLQAVAVDLYRKKNYEYILEQVTKSIELAYQNLRPATLYKTKAIINGVQKNKWRLKDQEHFDKRASFLMAKDTLTDEWMGGLVNFSIHGGTMPMDVMLYSSDVNGAIEHELEDLFAAKNSPIAKYPTFLFMNGAEGDVGAIVDRSVEGVTVIGKKFIEQAAPVLEQEQNFTEVEGTFSVKKQKLFVGIPSYPLKPCVDGLLAKLPKWFKLSIYPLFPKDSYISQAKVGDILYLSWPGEPSTQLGYNLEKMAQKYNYQDVQVLGLVNDYMTYFVTKEQSSENAYDTCSSYYGWQGGERIHAAHEKMLK
jgi:hypothetical protein